MRQDNIMAKIAVLLTCYNRKNKTINCIKTLAEGNSKVDMRFVVVDDNSTDGTQDALLELPYKIKLIPGSGNLYWGGGMRHAMNFTMKKVDNIDYVLLVNDDVSFYANAIEKMLDEIETSQADVVVGACKDHNGNLSYGGVKKKSKIFAKFDHVEPGSDKQCDTFNGNCVLIRRDVFKEAGLIDKELKHSMGDYDYGMTIKRKGYTIISSSEYVGECDDNAIAGTWQDRSLSRKERLKLKETTKGLPRKDWYYFVKKNYGVLSAMYHSATPYIKIMIKR